MICSWMNYPFLYSLSIRFLVLSLLYFILFYCLNSAAVIWFVVINQSLYIIDKNLGNECGRREGIGLDCRIWGQFSAYGIWAYSWRALRGGLSKETNVIFSSASFIFRIKRYVVGRGRLSTSLTRLLKTKYQRPLSNY